MRAILYGYLVLGVYDGGGHPAGDISLGQMPQDTTSIYELPGPTKGLPSP